jgi:SAM-dependent methyltransferase
MPIKQTNRSFEDNNTTADFAELYDNHAEYAARRVEGSFEQEKIEIEVAKFKIPNLVGLLPKDWLPQKVLEIGCATGELIAAFPVATDGYRAGVDISASNIAAARARFPTLEFFAGNFTDLSLPEAFDCVILSDILEHVEDDAGFLSDAASLGQYVLVNLPLEDNWLNRNRAYGINDPSGHLRNYTCEQGLDMFKRAGLNVVGSQRVWVHETNVLQECRELRQRHCGVEYTGSSTIKIIKQMVMYLSSALPPLGRRLFASNLFVIAQKK